MRILGGQVINRKKLIFQMRFICIYSVLRLFTREKITTAETQKCFACFYHILHLWLACVLFTNTIEICLGFLCLVASLAGTPVTLSKLDELLTHRCIIMKI